MLTMTTVTAILLSALCFVCVSSNDELHIESSCEDYSDSCATLTFVARLGSSVLLPCNFSTNIPNPWVSWSHGPGVTLIALRSDGRMKFQDPRHGRVKAFPNQASEGNYSISVDRLKYSDLGCYRCQLGKDCLQVQLLLEKGARGVDTWLLIYIGVGVVAFLLLSICSYCCIISIQWCFKNGTQYNLNSRAEGVSVPGTFTVGELQRGANSNDVVYENDDQDPGIQPANSGTNHSRLRGAPPGVAMAQPAQSTGRIYPDLNQFNVERGERQKTKRQSFHRELFSRLRQTSLSRHFYVNQGEISRQQAASAQAESQHRAGHGKKKAGDNFEFKNPIYNRSVDRLNEP